MSRNHGKRIECLRKRYQNLKQNQIDLQMKNTVIKIQNLKERENSCPVVQEK